MGHLDPSLRLLLAHSRRPEPGIRRRLLVEIEEESPVALAGAATPEPIVTVLLQFRGSLAAIETAGFRRRTVAGDVATGDIPLASLEEVSDLPEVVYIEASRTLEPELDTVVPTVRVDQLHGMTPARRGAGALVGIIDSGVHYPHGGCRRSDGTTRIVAIWDQRRSTSDSDAVAGEHTPTDYTYGVEWDDTDIDAALQAADAFTVVRHRDGDSGFHGTHVVGIAAGNGNALDPSDPVTARVGVAPEADIAVVRPGGSTEKGGLGASANALDALAYLLKLAVARGQPIAVNMSLGSNVGGSRDGNTLLERGIDNLLGTPGRVMVKSAGNEGNKSRHAQGALVQGATTDVVVNVAATGPTSAIIDIWYSFIANLTEATDEVALSITPPGGTESTVVNPGDDDGSGNAPTLTLSNGNEAVVDSTHLADFPWNVASRIFVRLQAGTQAAVATGTWTLHLRATTVATSGAWHAWIDSSPSPSPTFASPDTATTITIPGSAKEVVTAAAYDPSGGGIAAFSSRGPARDTRPVAVPTVAAPGVGTVAPVGPSVDPSGYDDKSGTSMAAPVVTGTLAVILAEHPHLNAAQLRDRLVRRARNDGQTGSVPNPTWGGGKLDAKAAFDDTDSTCFVATAVYHDPGHADVRILRALRDRRVAVGARGRAVAIAAVGVYARVGPGLARLVGPRPRLAAGLRRWLFRPVVALLRRLDADGRR